MRIPRGLYLLTRPVEGGTTALLDVVERALAGGARMVQYREKSGGAARREGQAAALLELCRSRHAPLIINDDPLLAARVGADGVHLGRDDPPLVAARELLGRGAIIGVSCYDSLELARRAADAGADYLAFGSFFPSPTKPGAVRAERSLLSEARALGLPLCAIGGLTPDNGGELVAAGASLIAVISGVFDAGDPRLAASRYAALFEAQAT